MSIYRSTRRPLEEFEGLTYTKPSFCFWNIKAFHSWLAFSLEVGLNSLGGFKDSGFRLLQIDRGGKIDCQSAKGRLIEREILIRKEAAGPGWADRVRVTFHAAWNSRSEVHSQRQIPGRHESIRTYPMVLPPSMYGAMPPPSTFLPAFRACRRRRHKHRRIILPFVLQKVPKNILNNINLLEPGDWCGRVKWHYFPAKL